MITERAVVAAIDPGLVSGVTVVTFTTDGATRVSSDEIEFPRVLDWAMAVKKHYGGMGSDAPLYLVAEDFVVTVATAKKSFQPWSLYGIGIVRAVGLTYGHEVALQRPADAKGMVSNDMLREAGLWHRGGAGHANDALRHAVLYAVRTLRWRPPYLSTLVRKDT